jgi:hypothetical protein
VIEAAPGQAFEAVVEGFPTGLVGTLGVRILNNQGGTHTPRTTAGVAEFPAGSGRYEATLTAPGDTGQFSVFWDDGAGRNASEALTVTTSATSSSSGVTAQPVATHDIDDPVTLTATFEGSVLNVADVTATVRSPSGVVTTPAVGAGAEPNEFYAVVTATEPGDWWYTFAVDNGPVEQGVFHVRRSQIQQQLADIALTTVEAVREVLRLPAGKDTEKLQRLINSTSRAMIDFTGRQFLPLEPGDGPPETTVVKTFTYDGRGFLNLEPYEAREITAVGVRGDTGPAWSLSDLTDWWAGPPEMTPEGTYLWLSLPEMASSRFALPSANLDRPWQQSGVWRVDVTGRWGAGVVPLPIEDGVIESVANRYRNPEGFARRQLGEGDFTPFADPAAQGVNLTPAARQLAGPYRRQRARMRNVTTA